MWLTRFETQFTQVSQICMGGFDLVQLSLCVGKKACIVLIKRYCNIVLVGMDAYVQIWVAVSTSSIHLHF